MTLAIILCMALSTACIINGVSCFMRARHGLAWLLMLIGAAIVAVPFVIVLESVK